MPAWISPAASRPSPAHRRASGSPWLSTSRVRASRWSSVRGVPIGLTTRCAACGAPADERTPSSWTSHRKMTSSGLSSMRGHAFGRLDIMICNAGFGYYGTVEETPAPIMQRMMDVNFMGTFYGARAALPIFRAQGQRPSDHRLVDRRAARHRADERVQRDEGRAGRVRRVAANGIHRHRYRRQRRAAGFDGDGISLSDGTRLRTHRVGARARSSPSTRWRGPIVACVRKPSPEVYPHASSRALTVANAIAPGFTDKVVRKYGRRREGR